MLIDWLVCVVYLGLLLAWQPATWAVSVLQVGAFALGGWFVVRWMRGLEQLRVTPEFFALAIIIAWGPLQILLRLTVYAFETWNSTLNWVALACIYLVAKTTLRDRAARDRFLSIQIALGSALAILSVLLNIGSPDKIFLLFPSRYTAWGPFIYKNQFATFLELLIPVAFYRMLFPDRKRFLYVILFAALLACMAASLSRAGVVIAFAETTLLTALSFARGALPWRTLRNVGIPFLLLVVLFTTIVGWDAMASRFREQNPYAMRAQLVRSTWEMVKRRPLAGYGLGTWRTVYPEFATFDIARVANEAHNDWLEWMAEGGVFFALVVFFFAAYVSRHAWKHLWGLGVPAVFLHCLVDYPTRTPAVAAILFLFCGALASVETSGRKRAASRGEWGVVSVRAASE